MDDSDSDCAFESADEGEETTSRKTTPLKHKKKSTLTASQPVKELNSSPVLIGDIAVDKKKEEEEMKEERTQIEPEIDLKTIDSTLKRTEAETLQSIENLQVEENSKSVDNCNEQENLVDSPGENDVNTLGKNESSSSKSIASNEVPEPTKMEPQSSGWGWNSWGTSLLSTATSSVSTFTSQVGQGFSTVLETVETTLGAPPPEELALQKKSADSEKEEKELTEEETVGCNEETNIPQSASLLNLGGLISGVSAITNVIESTGTKVLSSGLDTLELLGKKTMDVLQEGDPGFKKKRALFQGNKPNLSQVLKDAKLKAETEDKQTEEKKESQAPHFTTLFDEFNGLVHLEALEMLSKQCDSTIARLSSLLNSEQKMIVEDFKEKAEECFNLETLDDLNDEEEDHEFASLILESFDGLGLDVSPEKMIETQQKTRDWLKTCEEDQKVQGHKFAQDIHLYALQSLAEITAKAIEQFHKISELLLLPENEMNSKKMECISKYARIVCIELQILSRMFSHSLNTAADDSEDPDSINPLITNVFLEASNCSTYVQDALLLIIAVIEVNLMENLLKS